MLKLEILCYTFAPGVTEKMPFGDEAECFQSMSTDSGATTAQICHKQVGSACKIVCLLLIAFFVLVTGCSGNKNNKAVTEALNLAMDRDSVTVFLDIGRVSEKCGDPFVGAKPITDQIDFIAVQKAGLVTITPDGPDFWKVDLVDPKPQVAEHLKTAHYSEKNGCKSLVYGFKVATKSIQEIKNIHEVTDEKSEVEFIWKWALTPSGAKLVDNLSQQELTQLNDNLKNPSLHMEHDSSFNLANMTQSSAPQSGKKLLKKSETGWVPDSSQPAAVASPSPT